MNAAESNVTPIVRPKKRRLAVLVGVGAVALGFSLAFGYFRFARPIGRGPAGPAVLHEPISPVWSRRTVLLLGVGDSVTAGFGASHGRSYFDRLGTNPSDAALTLGARRRRAYRPP